MSSKLLIFLLAIVFLTPQLRADDDASPADKEKVAALVTVQTGALKLATLHRYIRAFGMVAPSPATTNAPSADAVVSAPMAGMITKLDIAEGQHVEKGERLLELNSATITYQNAVQQLERQKTLYAQQNTSLKNLQDAETQLALLQAAAPMSGTVVHVNVRAGQAVDVTTVVAEIMDLDRLVVNAEVPAADAGDLKTGGAAEVLTDPPFAAEIGYVSPLVNTNNDTILARLIVPTNSPCRPGQFVPLRIIAATHTNCLAAPVESVITDEDGKSSLARVKGDEADQVAVETGFREDGWVEIQGADLKAGDAIVTVGAYGLPDKTKIRVQTPPAAK
jgi:RND family efflux transporter MFP subunit